MSRWLSWNCGRFWEVKKNKMKKRTGEGLYKFRNSFFMLRESSCRAQWEAREWKWDAMSEAVSLRLTRGRRRFRAGHGGRRRDFRRGSL